MTTICGIELKGHEAILTVIEKQTDNSYSIKNTDVKKIELSDSENRDSVKEFKAKVNDFISKNDIELVCIKKRSKKGEYAGGPDTFKMEAIIQDSDATHVKLVSPQAISSHQKKHNIETPDTINKYQHNAYLTALAGAKK